VKLLLNINIIHVSRYTLFKVELEFGFTKLNRSFCDIDSNGLFLLKIRQKWFILKYTRLATIKIPALCSSHHRRSIYFGSLLQCHYVSMLKSLTGQVLVLILVLH